MCLMIETDVNVNLVGWLVYLGVLVYKKKNLQNLQTIYKIVASYFFYFVIFITWRYSISRKSRFS